MRTLALLLLMGLLSACQQTPPQPVAVKEDPKEPVRDYALHGEIVRLNAGDKIAAIKAGPIGDWMGAMTMEYPIKDEKALSTLRAGEKIDATVHVQGDTVYWIDQIHEATAAPAAK